MTKKFINVTSHNLTTYQIVDLQSKGFEEFVELPENLKNSWGSIDPNADEFEVYNSVEPIIDFVAKEKPAGIMLAGEITAVISIFGELIHNQPEIEILVATTRRESVESVQPDGSVRKTNVFKHVRFRELRWIHRN